jgi:ABC-type polysaccharide/polyol phosphate transport system ATPase subunit
MRLVFADVLDWAGITGDAHAPLRVLSTGTRARLAFSVVRYIATDVFLIDEALAAGDVSFRAKCRAFFDEPRNLDRTFLVATHDLAFARSFCSQALWLHEGRVMAFADSRTVVRRYLAHQSAAVTPPIVTGAAP